MEGLEVLYVREDGSVASGYLTDMLSGDRIASDAEVTMFEKHGMLEPKIENVRTAKLAEINTGYSAVMTYIQARYPTEEVLSWERQASQARELLVNPDAEAVFVRVLASQKGIPVPEMRDRILANVASWEPTAALLTAQRQIMEERTYMATTIEEIEAIKVGYSV